jgi:hypothetical protein
MIATVTTSSISVKPRKRGPVLGDLQGGMAPLLDGLKPRMRGLDAEMITARRR